MKKAFIFILLFGFSNTFIAQTVIPMEKKGGVYYLPCSVNGLSLKFIFDTGASDVSISLSEAVFMIKNGYMKEMDLRGTEYYRIANGEIAEGTKIIIRELKIGDRTLYNIEASIVHSLSAPLLLGQSAIEKFGTFSVDYATNILTLGGVAGKSTENKQTGNQSTKTKPIVLKEQKYVPEVKKYENNCKFPSPMPEEISIAIKECNQLYVSEKYSQCAKKYNELISNYPEYCIAYFNRGLARFNSGDKKGAKEDFEKAIELGFLEAEEQLIKHF